MSCCCDGPSIHGYELKDGDEIETDVQGDIYCCDQEMTETARDGARVTYTCVGCGTVLDVKDGLVWDIREPAVA